MVLFIGQIDRTGLVALNYFTRIADVAYATRDIILTKINHPLYIVSAMFLGILSVYDSFCSKGYKSNEYRLQTNNWSFNICSFVDLNIMGCKYVLYLDGVAKTFY